MVLRFTKRISLFILLGFFICLKPAFAEIKEPPRSMWVWDVKIFQDDAATERLLNFCKEKNIGTLFYTAYKVSGNIAADYRKFNKLAHKNKILVHALAGDPRWTLERYHSRFLEWVEDVLEFNRTSSGDEKFDAIHSDVEPYLLGKAWDMDHKSVLVQHFDMYKKAKDLIVKNGPATILVADIPFWYDDDVTMWVEWHKKISPACYHILDVVDRVAVMDYRNFSEGENGSILLVKNEIFYADGIGKKVYIGQETAKNMTPEYISFGNGTVSHMENQIKKIVDAYISHPSFAGIAMHHYISYKRLFNENLEGK